jgi:Arc-like DNA binding domain
MARGKLLLTRRRPSRTLRMCSELDDKLISAAETSGRSITEEIEYRLERSFRDEEIREQAFEQAWAAFEKKKTLEQVDTALDTVETAIANAKALAAEEPNNPGPISDALKEITQRAPRKGDKL